MNIDTSGRNPSATQYTLRGVAFLVVLSLFAGVLYLRSSGFFEEKVGVSVKMSSIGDGLEKSADVRYRGYIVGTVESVESVDGGTSNKVNLQLTPELATGIPKNVTARAVPSNIFAVNAIELVAPESAETGGLATGATILEDRSKGTIALQDALNDLRQLFTETPPEKIGAVVGSLSDAFRGGGAKFGQFVTPLGEYFKQINQQFPAGAPPGFENFSRSMLGLSQSAPELFATLDRSILATRTIADNQRNLAGLISGLGGMFDRTNSLFAANGDNGIKLVRDLNTMLGAMVYSPNALPEAVAQLSWLFRRLASVNNGRNGHVQLEAGLSLTPMKLYKSGDCPVYDGGPYGVARGANCGGPGMPARPGGAAPVAAITSPDDRTTLSRTFGREATGSETFLLGPLVSGYTAGAAGEGER